MSHLTVRKEGRAGRITLTRPKALNALSHDMCRQVMQALIDWNADAEIDLVILDAEGDKAFCAGGDVSRVYQEAKAGNGDAVRLFWRDEYRMNAMIAEYPKAVFSFLQGFTMGGGVGLGCHGSHRVVGETAQVAMPECAIGLVPDVGGSYLLARTEGHIGEYLALTGARMGPGDAINAGFADLYVPEARWPDLIARLEETGQPDAVTEVATTPPEATLPGKRGDIDALFGGETLHGIVNRLRGDDSDLAAEALRAMERSAPLSMGAALDILHRMKLGSADIRKALELEYRFTHRALEHGDFLEGVRAMIVEKDRAPRWRHEIGTLSQTDVTAMLQPVPEVALDFHDWKAAP
ncbi:enoyl-CoA hydratase/isomerase family protein [Roseivivax sediminis]|uniref:3-hydroxyisobutyryl-CoA hydrolase n=1 Tax=Roseivivax sediminis TaxID=936889 RepID=A0A1I1VB66_9RHOB|nr:enoyl-CoA hydratase/isomerase family protein [Roseivivax sediminis]SFD80217.1 Enoyl-CoA hydratase/carnithine racemase [Roseivivax sediminis]